MTDPTGQSAGDPGERAGLLDRLFAVSSAINEAIVRIRDERELFQEACRIAVERGALVMAWVGIHDAASGVLEPVAHAGRNSGYLESIEVSSLAHEPEGRGPGGQAFRTGQMAICNDIAADRGFFASRREALERGYRSCAAFPLAIDGETIGVFVAYASRPVFFVTEELELLGRLAGNFSFALSALRTERRRRDAELSLRTSEARLRSLIDAEPECVKTVSPQGLLQDMNPAGLAMIQADGLAQAQQVSFISLVHPDDREAFQGLHERALRGDTGRLRFRARGLRGGELWMDTHSVPLRDHDGAITSVLSITRDITTEVKALEEVRQSQSLLAIASRLGRIGAWQVDMPSRRLMWSAELREIFALPPGFAPTVAEALALYAPEYRAVIQAAYARCALTGEGFDEEVEVLTADGARLWVRVIGEAEFGEHGRVEKMLGAFQDISRRKHADQQIKALSDQFVITLESIQDALVSVDRAWTITYMNAEAEKLLGLSRDDLVGAPIWSERRGGPANSLAQLLRDAMATGTVQERELFFGPSQAWLELRVYPALNGITVYFRDVTGQRNSRQEVLARNATLEDRVRERTRQLEAANRELEAFSYSVAHDLRAPLGAINSFSQALEHEIGGDPALSRRASHFLARMRAGLNQTFGMIDALLALAQVNQAQLRWDSVDLGDMARASFEALQASEPGRNVELVVESPMEAAGDERLLRLLLDNLIGNAWKFTRHVAAARITLGETVTPDGERCFFIRDNGAGFDMAYAGKLFGAFQRMHSQAEFPGTGVGLANVMRIVMRHSGRIWAESARGEGAAFYFTLSASPPAGAGVEDGR